jgi:hypothetical protein
MMDCIRTVFGWFNLINDSSRDISIRFTCQPIQFLILIFICNPIFGWEITPFLPGSLHCILVHWKFSTESTSAETTAMYPHEAAILCVFFCADSLEECQCYFVYGVVSVELSVWLFNQKVVDSNPARAHSHSLKVVGSNPATRCHIHN